MMWRMRKAMRSKEGFTLIELLVVIAVLGILAAIAVPKFADMRSKATATRVHSEMKQVQTALEMYYAENGAYPADGEALADFQTDMTSYAEMDFLDNYGGFTYALDAQGVYTVTVTLDGVDYTVQRTSINP